MTIEHTTVRDAEERLRDVVNRHSIQDELIKDSQKWRQLCASMDVIGDTDAAVAAYERLEPVEDIGTLYLIAYGLLQVLFVQQDAVRHAAEAVGFNYTFSRDLRDIRHIRNRAVGHPTKHGSGNPESFGIIRVSLKQTGFTFYSFDWDDGTPKREVSLPDLIDLQIFEVCAALDGIVRHLKDCFGCP